LKKNEIDEEIIDENIKENPGGLSIGFKV